MVMSDSVRECIGVVRFYEAGSGAVKCGYVSVKWHTVMTSCGRVWLRFMTIVESGFGLARWSFDE